MDDRMWPTGCLNTVCEFFCGSFERACEMVDVGYISLDEYGLKTVEDILMLDINSRTWTVLYNGREVVTDRLYKKI